MGKWAIIATLTILTAASVARAEQVEIVTYYPSPSATTDDVRAKRATVGSGYKALNLDDPLAPIADGTLLVEQSVGVGAPVPFKTAPDPSGKSPKNGLLGNLDVNDIWLRSTQSWASQALAADVAPPKPFTFALELAPDRSSDSYGGAVVSFNIYAALQLWRSGVQPGQLRITGAKMISWYGEMAEFSGGRPTNNIQGGFWGTCEFNPSECGGGGSGHPWPADYPGLRNGWVGTRSKYKGTGVMEVTVDW